MSAHVAGSENPVSVDVAAADVAVALRPDFVHFVVQAAADPATLSRVLEYFVLNNILPETVRSRRFVGGDLTIEVKVKGLDEQRASVILNKLRSSVLVYSASLEWVSVLRLGGRETELRAVA